MPYLIRQKRWSPMTISSSTLSSPNICCFPQAFSIFPPKTVTGCVWLPYTVVLLNLCRLAQNCIILVEINSLPLPTDTNEYSVSATQKTKVHRPYMTLGDVKRDDRGDVGKISGETHKSEIIFLSTPSLEKSQALT